MLTDGYMPDLGENSTIILFQWVVRESTNSIFANDRRNELKQLGHCWVELGVCTVAGRASETQGLYVEQCLVYTDVRHPKKPDY